MDVLNTSEAAKSASFGRRRVVPRVCIVDRKRHIRQFLRAALEEMGFVACECAEPQQFATLTGQAQPDLVMLSLFDPAPRALLEALAAQEFAGEVLAFGPSGAPLAAASMDLASRLGLTVLPLLATPFSARDLHDRIAHLVPAKPPPEAPVDVAEALKAGWLELWYQPKIATRNLTLAGAEALVRMRHPNWGIVAPAYFIPSGCDPNFRAFSEFVIGRALADWRYFLSQYGRLRIAINLPCAYFQDADAVRKLAQRMAEHPVADGLIVEMNGSDIAANLPWAKEVARQLRFANIGVSIDDLGAEWPAFAAMPDFPFAEIKVDRAFIAGCAIDRLKQTVCRQILDLADGYGARTVAEGVETRADFITVRELGFDLVQGFVFARPKPAKDFARASLREPIALPG